MHSSCSYHQTLCIHSHVTLSRSIVELSGLRQFIVNRQNNNIEGEGVSSKALFWFDILFPPYDESSRYPQITTVGIST